MSKLSCVSVLVAVLLFKIILLYGKTVVSHIKYTEENKERLTCAFKVKTKSAKRL
jgi:hypothetical protein